MPFLMDYTAPSGTNYPESFWLISMVSLNHLNHTGILHYNGYADMASYNAGDDFVAQQAITIVAQESITINDSGFYNSYIGHKLENPHPLRPFYDFLETAAQSVTNFFGGGKQFSPAKPKSLEVGAETDSRINVVFSSALTGIDAGAGVTININGSPASVTGADQNTALLPAFAVYYDISRAVEIGDVVTWEYDSGSGVLTSPGLLPLHNMGPIAVTNTVGEYLDFSRASNSMHMMML